MKTEETKGEMNYLEKAVELNRKILGVSHADAKYIISHALQEAYEEATTFYNQKCFNEGYEQGLKVGRAESAELEEALEKISNYQVALEACQPDEEALSEAMRGYFGCKDLAQAALAKRRKETEG